MAKSGPIILVEDDFEDQEIFTDALKETGSENELLWFKTSAECMAYLRETEQMPFLIFCDVNLPMQNGLDFKQEVDQDPELRRKSIPFLFYSTSVGQLIVNEAYTQMTVQGFFQKQSDFKEIITCLKTIIDYWNYCHHPNMS